MILAGDIGGTKTTLALYRPDDPIKAPHKMETFASGAHDGLEAIIEAFLAGEDSAPIRACFGVAGPVVAHRTASITNLPWVIDAARLETRFGFARCALLNDLEATATAVPTATVVPTATTAPTGTPPITGTPPVTGTPTVTATGTPTATARENCCSGIPTRS